MSEKLASLSQDLEHILNHKKSVCLWFSGGADSRLLLETLIKIRKQFCILRFDNGWSRKQKKIVDAVILKNNLQVFSYPPTNYLLFKVGNELSFSASYAVDRFGNTAEILRDIIQGSLCAFDLKLETAATPSAPIEFDIHLWGTRGDDYHDATGTKPILYSDNWRIGEKEFFAPLYGWTKAEVLEGLEFYGVDSADTSDELNTGNVSACTLCFHGEKVICPKTNQEIEPHEWDPKANLKDFHEIIGVH